MNKPAKKLPVSGLRNFRNWENAYYTQHPEEIPYLEKELLEDLRQHPNMPLDVFLGALRRIAELYGMTKLAKNASLSRTHLYHALSPQGNPTVDTLQKMLAPMGYELSISIKQRNQPQI